MAVIDSPAETAAVASEATVGTRVEPTGFAAVLGTGDHKVVGRLWIATALLLGALVVTLELVFSIEGIDPGSLSIFGDDNVVQFWTLMRLGAIFLVAFPLVIGVAMVVVPLQIGSKAIAFPRAAAASYWAFLVGAGLFIASYAINGGPGGGREAGVNLWIASLGLVTLAILLAAVCLATTVFALRQTGLTLDRTPLFAWSVAVASVLWLLTLPVLLGLLALTYVDHNHAATASAAPRACGPTSTGCCATRRSTWSPSPSSGSPPTCSPPRPRPASPRGPSPSGPSAPSASSPSGRFSPARARRTTRPSSSSSSAWPPCCRSSPSWAWPASSSAGAASPSTRRWPRPSPRC